MYLRCGVTSDGLPGGRRGVDENSARENQVFRVTEPLSIQARFELVQTKSW